MPERTKVEVINDLIDVDTGTTRPEVDQILKWDGLNWVPADETGGGGGPETDPIVGAISGIVKADGGGNISAAVAGTDYVATEIDAIVKAIVGIVKSNGSTISAAVLDTDYLAPSSVIDKIADVDTTTDPPATNEVLKWNGSNWVPAVYNYDFAFSIASFSDGISDTDQLIGSGVWSDVGVITFTATYSNPPGGMTAWVSMSGASNSWGDDLDMVPVTGPELNTEIVNYPSSAGGTVTFTLHQSADGTTDTESVSFNNTMRYGNSAQSIGNQTEATLEALTEVAGPSESRSQTINNISTTANYLVFGYADRLSDVAQVQRNSGYGAVTASFNSTATTLAPSIQTGVANVANSVAFSETFACITSRLTGLANGTNDFTLLTTSTAINYIYWGELNKASGYTEANVEDNIATQPGKVGSNSMSSRSMTVNCTVDQYAYIGYPARLGALTSIIIGGFESLSDFNVDNTALAVTNPEGYQENYRVYVSENPGFTDPTVMIVTI